MSKMQNPATTPASSCSDDHVRSAPLTMMSRMPFTAYVRGSTFDRYCSAVGSLETGKMIPDSSICGTTTRGMNWTAWNSERANMLRKMPRLTAAIAIRASMPKIQNHGNVLLIFGMEALMAIAAVTLGIFLSMFARSAFQAVQFIPLVIVPQFLLSGIIFPVSSEPGALQWLSGVLPLTYAVNGMRDIMVKGADLSSSGLLLDAGVVAGFAILLIAAGTATLRRRLG